MEAFWTWLGEMANSLFGFFERPITEVLKDALDVGIVASPFTGGC